VIVFSQFSLKNKFLPKKVFLLLSVILISVSFICFIHFRDIYQGIITTEIAQNKEDIIECMEYNRMHTDSVVLWDTLLKKINTLAREKSLYLEVFYKETLNNCIRLRPNSGNLAFRKGKIETNDKIASNWFLRAQQFYPKNPRYMFAYAESLDKIGKTNDAIVWYKKAIERHHFAKKLSVNQWDFKLILLHSDQIKKANNTLLKIQSNAP
jgi:tetratricopeptide (TPR) repeat protein